MSSVAELPEVSPPQEASAAQYVETEPTFETGQFDYRPVPVMAVVGCALGVLSVISLLGVTGIGIAALGLIISGISILRITLSQGALGGKRIALFGLAMSFVFLISGSATQAYFYRTEVPPGSQRVSFSADISKKGFVFEEGVSKVHPDVAALAGQDVFLKGFMYPTGQMSGLASFLLVKDSGTCCFGGQPALQDMIGVIMQPDDRGSQRTVDYYPGRVSVAGTFRLNDRYTGQNSLEPLYLLEGKVVSKSRTAF